MRQFAEKQDTQINCITFGSLQFGHASLIRQIPSFTSPCELFGQHILISVTTCIYIKKMCLNIKNLEKTIIYILIVALKFRKPEQSQKVIPRERLPARPHRVARLKKKKKKKRLGED